MTSVRTFWDVLSNPSRLLERTAYVRSVLSERKFVAWALQHRARLAPFENDANEFAFADSTRPFRQAIEAFTAKHARTQEQLNEFREEFNEYSEMQRNAKIRLPCEWQDRFPCLDDRASTTPFDRHYTYHPAWAARVLAQTRPAKHIDISSTINFATLVSAFIPVEFYDYRPAPIALPGLECGEADLLSLPFADGSIKSLSCMHVLEHIGLGRYGDKLDPDGDLKAIGELLRVLAPRGDLLIAVPVGKPKVQFNAHRVYDAIDFSNYFNGVSLIERALIEESGDRGIIENPSDAQFREQAYGCGCFWFRKT
ncbi:DUF268 domain-containing protein [Variovorax sp. J22R24]|uniref:DUF268 domain-containing protein n=1 Tax=Variovorax gracilis TaxID=3053502 RepID=UPI0025775EA4|nr:DUF268 domain-containing protein [Variovorax sp. J22R24]MDM0104002.1 DUF268 domain-containing protein [Variovorax sp. J22R24]